MTELEWSERQYGFGEGAEIHSAENQKWQVTATGGKTVTITFAQFANKHFLKPSRKGLTPAQKAKNLWSKRSRSGEDLKAHHRLKYGAATKVNTVIDLSAVDLHTVVQKFATALLASKAATKDRWKKDEKRALTVDLGVARCLIFTNADGNTRRLAGTSVTFTASKSGDGDVYTVFHLGS